MNCKRCGVTVRVSQATYYDHLKLCSKCYKQHKKIGNNIKKVVY